VSKHLFILSSGPNDAIRAAGCLRFAKCAAEEGHEVVIMLSDDAVYMATRPEMLAQVKTPTGDEISEHLEVLTAHSATWLVCGRCAEARGISPDALPAGWKFAKPHVAIQLVEEGARQWVF